MMNLHDKKRELHEIYGIWHTPWWQQSWCKVITIVCAIAMCTALLFWVYRWYKQRTKLKRTPSEKARDAFAQLLSGYVTITPQEGERLYCELTRILKRYLCEQFGYQLHASTDQELLKHLEKEEFANRVQEIARDILLGSQGVKFAGEQALYRQLERHVHSAGQFVQETCTMHEQNQPNQISSSN